MAFVLIGTVIILTVVAFGFFITGHPGPSPLDDYAERMQRNQGRVGLRHDVRSPWDKGQ